RPRAGRELLFIMIIDKGQLSRRGIAKATQKIREASQLFGSFNIEAIMGNVVGSIPPRQREGCWGRIIGPCLDVDGKPIIDGIGQLHHQWCEVTRWYDTGFSPPVYDWTDLTDELTDQAPRGSWRDADYNWYNAAVERNGGVGNINEIVWMEPGLLYQAGAVTDKGTGYGPHYGPGVLNQEWIFYSRGLTNVIQFSGEGLVTPISTGGTGSSQLNFSQQNIGSGQGTQLVLAQPNIKVGLAGLYLFDLDLTLQLESHDVSGLADGFNGATGAYAP